MKNLIFKILKYFILRNYFYKIYLNFPEKNNFKGINNFDPIDQKKKSLKSLISLKNNYFSQESKNMISLELHSFDWLSDFKLLGGVDLIKKSRLLIIDWLSCNSKLYSNIWDDIIVARRLINLSKNYDFFALTSDESFKARINKLIIFHFRHLKTLQKLNPEKNESDIEVSKALLIFSKQFNMENYYYNISNQIKNQIFYQINDQGFHKSINVNEHARFINQLLQIKNIFLFYNSSIFNEIDLYIADMTSLLKNLFHLDNTLALFNGTNNIKLDFVKNIANIQKDIKTKDLFNVNDGLAVVNSEKTKLFFDITKPNSKQLNRKLHSGTLSFELSNNGEKVITNCGSPEKYLGKNQVFFRYSAAHSTIVINDTNISELSEKNGYKRIPKRIISSFENSTENFILNASHDGYSNNFNLLIKRTIKVSKNGNIILGTDQIIAMKKLTKLHFYSIRFHLMPNCNCAITNNEKKVIIKTKKGNAWYFESLENKIIVDESIYIGDGESPVESKQIILSGKTTKQKNVINWMLKKAN